MPLRDHFHPPLSTHISWDALHGLWPGMIVLDLNTRLPPEYRAEPRIHLGGGFEIDIGTVRPKEEEPALAPLETAGGVATALWAPPAPTLTFPTDLPEQDEYEV